MTQGPIAALSALTLSPAERLDGYTLRPTDGGIDMNEAIQGAISDIQSAATRLSLLVSVLPAGANKTTLTAQLALLTATS